MHNSTPAAQPIHQPHQPRQRGRNNVTEPATGAIPVPGKKGRGTRETFWLSLQTFCITRSVITLVLLGYLSLNKGREARALNTIVSWEAGALYLAFAVGCVLLAVYVRRRFMLQLVVQLAVDIVLISLLYIAAGGARSSLAILYLFPLAGAAILAPLVLALFFVSLVTLVLLAESGYQVFQSISADVSTSQAGLYGAAFFAAIYMVNRLAARLIKQEDLAARRGMDLRLQESINRLVVADMGDGVLVLGADTEVFTGNPAVERMLGLPLTSIPDGLKLSDVPALAPIADAFFAWKSGATDPVHGSTSFVMVRPGDADFSSGRGSDVPNTGSGPELIAHLKLRFAKVEADDSAEERTVIFMRDVSEIENQAQQLKLASMGRLTASIAHEVRNPLSAIAHAASLLSEDIAQPAHARLLRIVGDNVVRLDRMIEDILKLSRKAHVQGEPLLLAATLEEILAEFRESNALAPNMISVDGAAAHRVRFDALHLRQVVVNLLSNALRYASGSDASIRLRAVETKPGRLELHVQDDGPEISPEVRAHLFEPFYTTSSKGTGLGLYVARELCLNNGAMLDYEYRPDAQSRDGSSGRFVITFAANRA